MSHDIFLGCNLDLKIFDFNNHVDLTEGYLCFCLKGRWFDAPGLTNLKP